MVRRKVLQSMGESDGKQDMLANVDGAAYCSDFALRYDDGAKGAGKGTRRRGMSEPRLSIARMACGSTEPSRQGTRCNCLQ